MKRRKVEKERKDEKKRKPSGARALIHFGPIDWNIYYLATYNYNYHVPMTFEKNNNIILIFTIFIEILLSSMLSLTKK